MTHPSARRRTPPQPDRIYVGDACSVLSRWPDGFVDLVLTSPPYFALRDYGVEGQLGREQEPEIYIARLAAVLAECKRVLKPTGSLFLNLGDTYGDKSLLGIPWRVAPALLDDGWRIRNAVVWHKPRGRPSSVTDRLTNRYEFLFHFTQARVYHYDLDPIRVPHRTAPPKRLDTRGPGRRHEPYRVGAPMSSRMRWHPGGGNPGDVWSINPEDRHKRSIAPGAVAHFAAYPEALCERPILAACPPGGIVLDPFMGSGTTALVARRLGQSLPRDRALARLRRPCPATSAHTEMRPARKKPLTSLSVDNTFKCALSIDNGRCTRYEQWQSASK